MSVVAVRIYKDKIDIAADSITVYGDRRQTKDKNAKLTKIGKNFIVGTVGAVYLGNLFVEFCRTHQPQHNDESGIIAFITEFFEYVRRLDGSFTFEKFIDDSGFIIIWKDKVYEVSALEVIPIKNYSAIGAGDDYAIAAMHCGKSPKEAVAVACELSIYCEKPIKAITIKI